MQNIKNIMVTGGAGFMGSHFVRHLVNSTKLNVVVVDKLTYAGNLSSIRDLIVEKKCMFYLMDISAPQIQHIIRMEQIDAIVNFAAETHVDRSIFYPKAFLETDIMGGFNLVYHSLKEKIKLFLQVSTDEVYGPILEGEADESYPFNPTSPYSASKAAIELLLQSYRKTYGLPLLTVRCCNNFGSMQYPEKLIPMAITRLIEGKPVLLHGEGEEIREWIYVEDCVRRIVDVMLGGTVGLVYNIGSGFRLSNNEVVHDVLDCMGLMINKFTLVRFVPNRPNNDKRYAMRSAWPDYLWNNFLEDLRKTVEWYMANKDWWPEVDISSNFYTKGEYLR